ncbi:HAD family hydrolase [Streptomyces calidiresistens]|uniref:HAD-IA family hydrolase n=1 Tax=Streptomyces calidiresistens TaxID=1485586 RepID=A0A7W3SZM3_9ACTN|nr:HAD family hydrolase [Streptomyces calidiresistens]MBB0228244.1 HAD-IA family hydrolase [Streptomyces calidiresistens]
MRPTDEALKILEDCRAVLWDFDGPICDVFAGLPAAGIAGHLRETVTREYGTGEARRLHQGDDPLEVVRRANLEGLECAARVAGLLEEQEGRAIGDAAPTPGAHEVVEVFYAAGKRMAVTSNNAAGPISAYLRVHGLTGYFTAVIGRERVEVMKPDPHILLCALEQLGISVTDAVLIGDSTSDMQAARAAGTRAIGYANRPQKADHLEAAGADTIVTTMRELIPSRMA